MNRLNYASAGAVRRHPDADKLVVCRSDKGDGGWSLHRPGSTENEIMSGESPVLVSGEAEWLEGSRSWSRPNQHDYRAAIRQLGSTAS